MHIFLIIVIHLDMVQYDMRHVAKEAQKQKRLMFDIFFCLFCDAYYRQWSRISLNNKLIE